MSKKSFKGANPALAFISGAEEPAAEDKQKERPENEALNKLDTQNTDNTNIEQAARSERKTQDATLNTTTNMKIGVSFFGEKNRQQHYGATDNEQFLTPIPSLSGLELVQL